MSRSLTDWQCSHFLEKAGECGRFILPTTTCTVNTELVPIFWCDMGSGACSACELSVHSRCHPVDNANISIRQGLGAARPLQWLLICSMGHLTDSKLVVWMRFDCLFRPRHLWNIVQFNDHPSNQLTLQGAYANACALHVKKWNTAQQSHTD